MYIEGGGRGLPSTPFPSFLPSRFLLSPLPSNLLAFFFSRMHSCSSFHSSFPSFRTSFIPFPSFIPFFLPLLPLLPSFRPSILPTPLIQRRATVSGCFRTNHGLCGGCSKIPSPCLWTPWIWARETPCGTLSEAMPLRITV